MEGTGLKYTKQCKKCSLIKELEHFYVNSQTKDGRHSHCKECAKEISAARRANHPEKCKQSQRKAHLKYTYGITHEEYEGLYLKQAGLCAICGDTSKGKRLAVDHNHETGVVRGLLCQPCNTALGLLKDSTEVLNKAITYLT